MSRSPSFARSVAPVTRVRPRELPPSPADAFQVEAVTLFRSHLGGGRPARYEALERSLRGG